jgi:hypothetical protein
MLGDREDIRRCLECGHRTKGDKPRLCRTCRDDLRDVLRMLLGGGGLGYFITPRF